MASPKELITFLGVVSGWTPEGSSRFIGELNRIADAIRCGPDRRRRLFLTFAQMVAIGRVQADELRALCDLMPDAALHVANATLCESEDQLFARAAGGDILADEATMIRIAEYAAAIQTAQEFAR